MPASPAPPVEYTDAWKRWPRSIIFCILTAVQAMGLLALAVSRLKQRAGGHDPWAPHALRLSWRWSGVGGDFLAGHGHWLVGC